VNLDERHAGAVLTPPKSSIWRCAIHSNTSGKSSARTCIPSCRSVTGLDHVVGVVRSTRVLEQLLDNRTLDLATLAKPPL
jgi:hypothetical protein